MTSSISATPTQIQANWAVWAASGAAARKAALARRAKREITGLVSTTDRVERLMRDAKGAQIYEGTNQIHRLIVAQQVLDAMRREG